MKWLQKLNPKSRKFIIMIIMVSLYVGNDLAGGVLTEQAMNSIMGLVMAWLVSQGIADHGAQGKAKAIERMKNETAEFQNLMREVLGQGTPLADKLNLTNKKDDDDDDDDDETPGWDDTSEMDDEDRPKNLNG